MKIQGGGILFADYEVCSREGDIRMSDLRSVQTLGFRYTNTPDTPIARDLFIPCFENSSRFTALFAYFSSEVLIALTPGLNAFFQSHGKMRLSVYAYMKPGDPQAVAEGYEERERVAFEEARERLFAALREASGEHPDSVALLKEMIASGSLEILTVGPVSSRGVAHDKEGFFEDSYGDSISFEGSANFTSPAMTFVEGFWNHERVSVHRSWMPGEDKYVDESKRFLEQLFAGEYKWLQPRDITSEVEHFIDEALPREARGVPHCPDPERKPLSITEGIPLWEYQAKAVEAWLKNGCNGFFEMATGTGKTRTAIACIDRLWQMHSENPPVAIIVAPQRFLVNQWEGELNKLLGDVHPLVASSDNSSWRDSLPIYLMQKERNDPSARIVIAVTYATFRKIDFQKEFDRFGRNAVLVIDEAHHFLGLASDELRGKFNYSIGLSATPGSGNEGDEACLRLFDWFGGRVISYPIEQALKNGILCPYRYTPFFGWANEEECSQYAHYQKLIAAELSLPKPDQARVSSYTRARNRVLSRAQWKKDNLTDIAKRIGLPDRTHFIVYCGDGAANRDDLESVSIVDEVSCKLNNMGCLVQSFTSRESSEDKQSRVSCFDSEIISGLVAIRCLDEGVDIPSIQSALLLGNGTNRREFIQRRGRILRRYEGKGVADIYDIVLLPETENRSLAMNELVRCYEYGSLATNFLGETETLLQDAAAKCGISYEELKNNASDMSSDVDEEGDE